MFLVTFWFLLAVSGLIISFVGSLISLLYNPTIGIMTTMMGGMMMLVPVLQVTGVIKKFKLVPFFMALKKFEEITLFVNERFQIFPIVVNTKHEGIIQQKELGLIEDKGSPLTWGDIPCSISLQGLGVTLNLKIAQYSANLSKTRNLNSYEEAIKKYLGPAKYTEFFNKFRRNPKPDILDINRELHYLIHVNKPNDPLMENILGETIDFRHFCNYLIYAYHPRSSQNAMDAEKIWVKKEAMAYKETDKVGSIGKLIFVIVIAIIIFIIVWNAIGGIV